MIGKRVDSKVFIISLNTMSLFFYSLTKGLSKICKFFVLVCMKIIFARDKSSLVLSLENEAA